jgi:hypothetical protein
VVVGRKLFMILLLNAANFIKTTVESNKLRLLLARFASRRIAFAAPSIVQTRHSA